MNFSHRLQLRQSVLMTLTILLALGLGLLVLALDGFAPDSVIRAGYQGIFGSSQRAANALARITIIALLGLTAAVPFSAGIWNIGGEGQLVIGAICAALIGLIFGYLPAGTGIVLSVLAAIAGGALWAAIPAVLKLKFRADEIVTTIMFNYLALLFTEYLANYPFRAPGSSSAETVVLSENAQLPGLVPLSMLSAGAIVAACAIVVIYILMKRAYIGYEWRVAGSNLSFARYGGVRVPRVQFASMLVGGGLAGLAGGILVLGVHHRFVLNIAGGMAFTGVLIAIIAANSPILVVALAGLFGLLLNATLGMESRIGVPVELSDVVSSTIIILILAREPIGSLFSRVFSRRRNHR